MQIRLITEGFDERHPVALCNSDGLVVARFADVETAKDWATRNRFEVVEDTFPEYLD